MLQDWQPCNILQERVLWIYIPCWHTLPYLAPHSDGGNQPESKDYLHFSCKPRQLWLLSLLCQICKSLNALESISHLEVEFLCFGLQDSCLETSNKWPPTKRQQASIQSTHCSSPLGGTSSTNKMLVKERSPTEVFQCLNKDCFKAYLIEPGSFFTTEPQRAHKALFIQLRHRALRTGSYLLWEFL